jgi:hypothetical protein
MVESHVGHRESFLGRKDSRCLLGERVAIARGDTPVIPRLRHGTRLLVQSQSGKPQPKVKKKRGWTYCLPGMRAVRDDGVPRNAASSFREDKANQGLALVCSSQVTLQPSEVPPPPSLPRWSDDWPLPARRRPLLPPPAPHRRAGGGRRERVGRPVSCQSSAPPTQGRWGPLRFTGWSLQTAEVLPSQENDILTGSSTGYGTPHHRPRGADEQPPRD